MATNLELEKKVVALEQSFNESQDAIRRLAQENNNLVGTVARLSDNVNKNTAEIEMLKKQVQQLASRKSTASVSNY